MKSFLAILLLFLPALSLATGTNAPHWKLVPGKSIIAWEANYGGQLIKGEFRDFTSDIVFDPAHLEESSIKIVIDTAKIESTESNAKSMLPGKEWLDVAEYPTALFETENIKAAEANEMATSYNAAANTTIRGKTIQTILPFTIQFSADQKSATVIGETVLKRLDFGLGTGEWANPSIIANEVKIRFHVEAVAE